MGQSANLCYINGQGLMTLAAWGVALQVMETHYQSAELLNKLNILDAMRLNIGL